MTIAGRVFDAAEQANREAILELARARRGGRLLDLGCGDGSFTMRLAERIGATTIAAVETDAATAGRAEERGIEVHRSDLNAPFPFANGSVDVVHTNQVIEHIARTDHFVSEIRRVLKPDGYALISTNNLASMHNIASLIAGWQPMPAHVSDEFVGLGNPLNPSRGMRGARGQMHLRLFTSRALRELCAAHGLSTVEARAAGFYPLSRRSAAFAVRLLPMWGAFLVQRLEP
jgi:SAM-dependent methyltransferase